VIAPRPRRTRARWGALEWVRRRSSSRRQGGTPTADQAGPGGRGGRRPRGQRRRRGAGGSRAPAPAPGRADSALRSTRGRCPRSGQPGVPRHVVAGRTKKFWRQATWGGSRPGLARTWSRTRSLTKTASGCPAPRVRGEPATRWVIAGSRARFDRGDPVKGPGLERIEAVKQWHHQARGGVLRRWFRGRKRSRPGPRRRPVSVRKRPSNLRASWLALLGRRPACAETVLDSSARGGARATAARNGIRTSSG